MFKKVVSCILILSLLSLSVVYASESSQREPDNSGAKWSYTVSTSTLMSISSTGKATCVGSITGYQNLATSIDIFLYLERYINGTWTTYPGGSWYQYFPSHKGTLSATIYVTKGYNYRLRASYYANSGSNWENIPGLSPTVYY